MSGLSKKGTAMIYALKNHSISTSLSYDYNEVICDITIKYHKENQSLHATARFDGETFTADENGIEVDIFTIISRLEEESAKVAYQIKEKITRRWTLEQNTVYTIDIDYDSGTAYLRFVRGIENEKARIIARIGPTEYEITCGQNRVWFPKNFPYTRGTIYRQIVTLGRAHWHEQTYHGDID